MKGEAPLQKHTLNLYEGELDEIAALFPDLPKSVVVRELVHNTIERHREAARAEAGTDEVTVKVAL